MLFQSTAKKTAKTARSSSKHRGHHRTTASSTGHLNPRKISVQSKRLTRQQARARHQEPEVASSSMEYDLESGEMIERKPLPRSKELEQIIAASSSSHQLAMADEQEGSETDSEVVDEKEEMSDEEEEEDQQEYISETSESMVV